MGLTPIQSPEKRCGKTTLIGVLTHLVHRALPVSNVTPAALFRAVEKYQPTLLIDEADAFVRGSEELRGILNSGHSRHTAFVLRTVGDDHEPTRFSTWCAKAIASIGELPSDTLTDRSIIVPLRRKLPEDKSERLPIGDPPASLLELRQMIIRWVADNKGALLRYRAGRLKGASDRAADNWNPLLAIAGVAHREKSARKAAEVLNARSSDHDSQRVLLLRDMRDMFKRKSAERIRTTEELLPALHEMETRPWAEFQNGQPITPTQLAKLLRPFGIRPKEDRDGKVVNRGYRLSDCQDAFTRYLRDAESGE